MKKVLVFLCLLGLVNMATADLLYLTPVADSTVDFEAPDTAFPTGELIAQRVGDVGETCTQLKNFFMQFQLPAGLTGADIAAVNSANIEMLQTSTQNLSLLYYTYGVNDGLDTASCDTYTWNNAPGFKPENNLAVLDHTHYYDPDEAVWIGTTSTREPISYQMYYTTSDFATMIMDDTDGLLTFFVAEYQYYNYLKTWASMESLWGEPIMALDYTLVPEPASMILLGLGALWMRRKRNQ